MCNTDGLLAWIGVKRTADTVSLSAASSIGAATMFRTVLSVVLLSCLVLCGGSPLEGQVRVTPKEAKGGQKQGEPWAEVPEGFKNMKIPDWPMPTDLKRW